MIISNKVFLPIYDRYEIWKKVTLMSARRVVSLMYTRVLYIYVYINYMTINLHFTSRKKHRQTKLHDRQIPIYWKVPGSVKKLITIINIYM